MIRKLNSLLHPETKPADAMPIFEEAMKLRKDGTQEEKNDFQERLKKAFQSAGRQLLNRAIHEKLINVKEYADWCTEFGMSEEFICPILEAYYIRKDGHEKKEEELVLLTTNDTLIDKMRKILKEKFNLEVTTVQEYVEKIKREEPEAYKEIMVKIKKEKSVVNSEEKNNETQKK